MIKKTPTVYRKNTISAREISFDHDNESKPKIAVISHHVNKIADFYNFILGKRASSVPARAVIAHLDMRVGRIISINRSRLSRVEAQASQRGHESFSLHLS